MLGLQFNWCFGNLSVSVIVVIGTSLCAGRLTPVYIACDEHLFEPRMGFILKNERSRNTL